MAIISVHTACNDTYTMLLLTCGREWNMVDLRFVATRLGLGKVLDTAYVGSNPTDRTNIKDNYD